MQQTRKHFGMMIRLKMIPNDLYVMSERVFKWSYGLPWNRATSTGLIPKPEQRALKNRRNRDGKAPPTDALMTVEVRNRIPVPIIAFIKLNNREGNPYSVVEYWGWPALSVEGMSADSLTASFSLTFPFSMSPIWLHVPLHKCGYFVVLDGRFWSLNDVV